MADINFSQARSICTAAELRLVKSSSRQAIGKLSEEQLKKKITLARELRDKWRDLYTRQRREVQQKKSARQNEKNVRSQQKSELFGAVLARFEAQLKKVTAAGSPPKSAAGKPPKSRRTQQHRKARSRVREKMTAKTAAWELGKLNPPPAPATSAASKAKKDPVAEPEPGSPRAKKPKKSPGSRGIKTAAKKPKRPPKNTPASKATAPKRQSRAQAAAKRARIKTSGMNTRIRGHVSARGKRSQARRDTKR